MINILNQLSLKLPRLYPNDFLKSFNLKICSRELICFKKSCE